MQRRPEFSFPGSPARGRADRLLPPRPPVNAVPPMPREEEEVRWLQASRQASPESYYYHSSSGTPSPQLWAQDQNRQYPASAGSSPSRAQAISGYRREMLDLVRGLPESAYELSLRDIVEHRHPSPSSSPPPSSVPLPTPPPLTSAGAAAGGQEEPANTAADEQAAKQSNPASKKQGRKERAVRRQRSRSLERSVSLDTGLLIKFFMPLSIRGRGGGGKKKVSPKPDAPKDSAKKKQKKQGTKKKDGLKQDDEWWSKSEFSEASGTSSRTSSTGSSNSNGSTASVRNGGGNGGNSNAKAPVKSRSRKRNGCYAFFRGNKTKNGASQD